MWDVRFGMGHRVRSQRSDVRSQTTEDRRQKRAELVEEWSIMSDWGFWILDCGLRIQKGGWVSPDVS
jgi:hypothetical protein